MLFARSQLRGFRAPRLGQRGSTAASLLPGRVQRLRALSAHARLTAVEGSAEQLSGSPDWCAAYINLQRREDRRKKLAAVLAPENMALLAKLSRIDAVDGQQVDLEDEGLQAYVSEDALALSREAERMGAYTVLHSNGRLVKFHNHLTKGGVACVMSHHAALRAVAEHPTADFGLILEDDISALVPNVDEAISDLVARLPGNWDACYLGYHGGILAGTGEGDGGVDADSEHGRACLELQIDEGMGPQDGFHGAVDAEGVPGDFGYETPVLRMYAPVFGLYSWLVRKEAAKTLLENAFPVHGQVDHAISQWLLQNGGKAFRVAPRHLLFFSPKSEDGMDSDIQTMADIRELSENPAMAQRYVAFCNDNPNEDV